MRYNIKDLTDKRFGRLIALEKTEKRDGNSIVWRCKCDCGNVVEISSKRLVNNINQSCGCYQKERQRYSMHNLQKKQLVESTNIDLIAKKQKNKNNKTSNFRGIHFCRTKKKWIATLTFQKKLVLNKAFNNIEDAIKARKEAEEKYFKPILDKYNKLD